MCHRSVIVIERTAAINAFCMVVGQSSSCFRSAITICSWPMPSTGSRESVQFFRPIPLPSWMRPTARQMFGVMLTAGQIQELIEELQNAKYLLAAETLEQTAKPLLEKLAQPREETEALEESLRLLAPLTRSMPIVQRQVGKLLPSPGRKRMDTLA